MSSKFDSIALDDIRIEPSWKNLLRDEFAKDYFKKLTDFVDREYQVNPNSVFPPPKKIFNAFELTPVDKVKVVILGQDPYHGANQAMGLSFSVNQGVRIPPSLQNIFKEIESDLGKPSIITQQTGSGDLTSWAKQGVLLLNSTLTVRAGSPGSHQNKGWEDFTDAVIRNLTESREGIVYLLWGKYAQNKGTIINEDNNLVIKSAHPSPFAAYRGFFGSKPFSRANEYLITQGKDKIKW